MHAGGCLCGAIRYEISGDLAAIEVCHCSQCRKAQGGAFATNISVAEAALQILSGRAAIREYESSPGKFRAFCSHCGSPLFSRRTALPGTVRIRAGTLDGPVATRPAVHFHVASCCDWWQIDNDGLPRVAHELP